MSIINLVCKNIIAIILAALSIASFYKDWWNPHYLKDSEGNPPEFPMPYVTMVTCLITGIIVLFVSIGGSFGVRTSVTWSILIAIIAIAVILAELIPNIKKWKLMNWTTIILIVLNWFIFTILSIIY